MSSPGTKPFKLFPYQEKSAAEHLRILDSVGASLDGTGCGGGKTVIASAVASRYGIPVAVICPKSVIAKWEDTLAAFGVRPQFVLNPEKLRTGRTPWLKKETKKAFKWALPAHSLLIFDEAHMFGAHNSLNGAMLEAASGQAVLMLSASAAESPLKMRSIGINLRLFSPRCFWKWVREMGAVTGRFGGLEWDPYDETNKEKMYRLHDSIYSCRGYRVPEQTLRDQLPELMESDESLWISPEDRAEIKRLYEEMSDQEDPGGVKNLRQRQAIEIVKVPYLAERASEIITENGSVVLFLNFHESIDKAAELLPGAEIIDGRQPHTKRLGTQKKFQENTLKVVIVQIAAGGQSIDLHDLSGEHPRTALICPQFSGLVEEQAVGRISRVGAKSRALALRLFVPGTIEKGAMVLTQEKRENVAIFNSGQKILNASAPHPVSRSMPEVITAQPEQDREHSEHSPSSLKEKAKCSGFRNDNTRDTSAADRGSLGHKAVETENLDIIPPEDPRLRDAAALCIKYINRMPAGTTIRERRYDILDQFGHIDRVVLRGSEADMTDYKFAFGEYEADSPQFWAYAVGVWDAHPEVDTINVHVLLPFQGVIDRETWTREGDYDRLAARVTSIIEAARRDDPLTYQTGVHCSWCSRRAVCPKLTSLALTIAAEHKPDELSLPPQFDPALISDPNVIALCKKAAPIMRSWADKVDSRALEMRVSEGIEIPGWELAERATPFKITDAQAAWEVVKDRLTPDAFASCAEVSIGSLEDAIARTVGRGGKAKAKVELRDALIDASAARVEGTYNYLKKTKDF
jgi:hypothetical protein